MKGERPARKAAVRKVAARKPPQRKPPRPRVALEAAVGREARRRAVPEPGPSPHVSPPQENPRHENPRQEGPRPVREPSSEEMVGLQVDPIIAAAGLPPMAPAAIAAGFPALGAHPMAQQVGRMQLETAMFWGRRWRATIEAFARTTACRTPADVWQLQVGQLMDFVMDAQRTMRRLGGPAGDRR